MANIEPNYNKDKTRAWHFFVSKEVFFKWEDKNKGDNVVELNIKNRINLIGEAKYKPVEIKG